MTMGQSLIALSGIFLLACCSPGPVFLLIASTSAQEGRRAGVKVALGVACATFLWSSLSLLGLGAILASLVWAQGLLRLMAGLYLIWLGLILLGGNMLRHARADQGGKPIAPSRNSALKRGFIASATNPKALAFFGSAFALTAPADPSPQYILAAIALLTLLSALWHSLLALLFAADVMQRFYRGLKRQIDLVVGTLLLAFGLGLLAQGLRLR